MIKYQQETWGELINFEKKFKDEMGKQAVLQEKMRYFTVNNIDWIKEKTSTYIECLEYSLTDLKLTSSKNIEHLMMTLEDYDSRQLNVLQNNDFMKSALEV